MKENKIIPQSIKFRKLRPNESEKVALIHINTFKGFFLTSLGKSFLTTYYKVCIKSPDVIAICATSDNQSIVGFAVGTINSKGFHKKILKKNILKFAYQGLILLFTKPKSILRLFKNLSKKSSESSFKDDGNYAELLSIGVSVEMKGKGIGEKILFHFEQSLKEKESKKISLTTDFYKNEAVLNFYKKNGYTIFYDFIAYPNRKMYKLIKEI